jgi:hypothetical protein
MGELHAAKEFAKFGRGLSFRKSEGVSCLSWQRMETLALLQRWTCPDALGPVWEAPGGVSRRFIAIVLNRKFWSAFLSASLESTCTYACSW